MQRARQRSISESVTESVGARTRRGGEEPRLAASARPDDVAPWRCAGPRDQSRLLDWFLSADLSTDVAYQVLCVLTGRRKPHEWKTEADIKAELLETLEALGAYRHDVVSWRARRRRVMPTGTETGRFGSQRFRSRSRLVAHFRKVQETLRRIQERFVKANETKSHTDRLHSSLSLNVLAEMLGDVRFDFAREDETEWPRAFGRRPLRRMPPELESSSMSLAGELAVALSQRMVGDGKVGRCGVCGSAWIAPDRKSRRILCGNPDCARARRKQRRKPELQVNVTARVARWRKAKKQKARIHHDGVGRLAETRHFDR